MTDGSPSAGGIAPSTVFEKVVLNGDNKPVKFKIGTDVVITVPEDNDRDRDSSNVQSQKILEYPGRVSTVRGRVLTTHQQFAAFQSIREKTNEETMRVMDVELRNRYRMKDNVGAVDVSFAVHAPLLAFIDEESSLYIYRLEVDSNVLKYISIVNWPSHSNRDKKDHPKIVWCPFITEPDGDPEDDICMIAVYEARHVHIINLSIITDSSHDDEIDFEEAKAYDGAIFTITLSDEEIADEVYIRTVAISPDATAIAIAKSSGHVSFYLLHEREADFAHNWDPRFGDHMITHLVFLDDLRPNRDQHTFWRACMALAQGGRIAIYECDKWSCISRVRFESVNMENDFQPVLDMGASFVHLLDIDGKNIFSLELQIGSNGLPRLTSVTQTTFKNHVYALANYLAPSNEPEDSCDEFFDADDDEKNLKTYNFVALTQNALFKLVLTLNVHPPSLSDEIGGLNTEIDESKSTKEEPLVPLIEDVVTHDEEVDRSVLEEKLEQLDAKLDHILNRVSRLESIVDAQDNSDSILNQFVERIATENEQRDRTVLDRLGFLQSSVDNTSMTGIESKIDFIENRLTSKISEEINVAVLKTMTEKFLPTVERMVEGLYTGIDEKFRAGLREYHEGLKTTMQSVMVQMVEQQTQVQPPLAGQDLVMMARNPPAAFEYVLNRADGNQLIMLCKLIDPDVLFASPTVLQPPILLSLLQQLSIQFYTDRELKYRYIENILQAMGETGTVRSDLAPNVLASTFEQLKRVAESDEDQDIRRRTRLMMTLISQLIISSPLPIPIA